jgi:amidophosphoribosyltransferase
MDFGEPNELLAHKLDIDGIKEFLGVDSLAYIEIHRLLESTGAREAGFCDACFTGTYPVEVPVELSKAVLEEGASTRIERGTSMAASAVLDQPSLLPADDARRTS